MQAVPAVSLLCQQLYTSPRVVVLHRQIDSKVTGATGIHMKRKG